MNISVSAFLAIALSVTAQAQVLDGDQRFPVLNTIQWDMSRKDIHNLCAAHNIITAGNDSTLTFDSNFFSTPAKVVVRFTKNSRGPWTIEVKFLKRSEHLADTLSGYFTRKLKMAPAKANQEKSALLFTLRMEVSVWKTAKERITLLLAKRDGSVFDISLAVSPNMK